MGTPPVAEGSVIMTADDLEASMDTARSPRPAPRRDESPRERAQEALARILRDARDDPRQYARDTEVPKGGE